MSEFVCVDCRRPKAAIESECQVIFGPEAWGPICPNCGQQHQALVGRCLDCGADLPAIDVDRPYRFRWNERAFQITLVWSPSWHVWLYLLEQNRGHGWENVKVIRTHELRQAIGKLDFEPISQDEVLDVSLALRRLPDTEFVAAFKALARR